MIHEVTSPVGLAICLYLLSIVIKLIGCELLASGGFIPDSISFEGDE